MKIANTGTVGGTHLNAIIYGLTGAGKTYFLGTSRRSKETDPMFIIDLDRGLKTIRRAKVDFVQPESFAELQEAYDFLRHDKHKYRSVGLDGLTEFQRGMSMGTIQEEIDDEFAYKELGKAKAPDRQDWLKSHVHVRKVIRAFRDLSQLRDPERRMHVFITSLEKADEARNYVCPLLPGVLGMECGAYVDILARLSVRERTNGTEVRTLQIRESKAADGMRVLAKNRMGLQDTRLDNPSIPKLMDLWMGGQERE